MEQKNGVKKLSRQLLDTIQQFNCYDRLTRSFGTDHVLFLSEIHLIDYIGSHRDCYISEIARELQVTKGAISQMVKKLERKGYLIKAVDTGNKTRMVVRLSAKGQIAFDGHCRYHNRLDRDLANALQDFTDEETAAVCQFLKRMEEQWKQHSD
ncbi:MarR family winged helix-turn-helix transcriptional regulator [Marasmitruncus massiliensis]|jgi:DNA-binding MarR family transcriptional regulator|uniref:MarR family winged helix-turn-helix transcriptional regulator n=1 Tax=Marasmitruncus massiliensis TaxID=1944642 RepID=UPI000C7C5456|nr:MarR family winged helix-turn-helix transcriptional regulator [Marasmitruncus massiliensis]MBE6906333.1 MarR family transcriptional regulator [Oscillospiraceae bacterium]